MIVLKTKKSHCFYTKHVKYYKILCFKQQPIENIKDNVHIKMLKYSDKYTHVYPWSIICHYDTIVHLSCRNYWII